MPKEKPTIHKLVEKMKEHQKKKKPVLDKMLDRHFKDTDLDRKRQA